MGFRTCRMPPHRPRFDFGRRRVVQDAQAACPKPRPLPGLASLDSHGPSRADYLFSSSSSSGSMWRVTEERVPGTTRWASMKASRSLYLNRMTRPM